MSTSAGPTRSGWSAGPRSSRTATGAATAADSSVIPVEKAKTTLNSEAEVLESGRSVDSRWMRAYCSPRLLNCETST
jgi:hypothetical protein